MPLPCLTFSSVHADRQSLPFTLLCSGAISPLSLQQYLPVDEASCRMQKN
jgi:hypothetical protein